MKIAVIIPTIGRKELVVRTLAHLEHQTRPPQAVFVSAPDEGHVAPYEAQHFTLSHVFGRKGLCAQRNAALVQAMKGADIVTFFDDDFLPAATYLERLEAAFASHPGWGVIMGHAVHDGARGAGFTFEEGLALLKDADATYREGRQENLRISDHVGAYGCNMSIRAALIGEERFDERLVLYGWQEDIDFTSRLRLRHGAERCRVVGVSTVYGVHLGVKAGRVSGVRFGYSQVANPVYLVRKGAVPASFAYELLARNVLANILKSFRPEPYVDRWGRLKGNALALWHLVLGRIEPEYILKL